MAFALRAGADAAGSTVVVVADGDVSAWSGSAGWIAAGRPVDEGDA